MLRDLPVGDPASLLGGFFGVVGALLAAIGLYGLLAYPVTSRTNVNT